MPRTASTKKALRGSIRRHAQNASQMNNLRNTLKDYKRLVSSRPSEAQAALSRVYQSLDKAAKKGNLAPNAAARLKSRLTKKLARASLRA